MKKYLYVGNGMGVPGLPHEVSDDEAAELGVLHILREAIENGSYVEAPSATPSAGQLPPNSESTNLGEKARKVKKGDVNNG
jgi:hypothetical protein